MKGRETDLKEKREVGARIDDLIENMNAKNDEVRDWQGKVTELNRQTCLEKFRESMSFIVKKEALTEDDSSI